MLEEVATHLVDGEQLCAFPDDVHLLGAGEAMMWIASRQNQSMESGRHRA